MGYKAVRTDRYKYIEYVELQGMDELYDLRDDPYEMNNMINSEEAATTLQDMKQELQRLLEESS